MSVPSKLGARAAVTVYIGVGANLGDAVHTVQAALLALAGLPGCLVRAQSSLYRTAPHQATGPDYINAVAVVQTVLTAPALLAALQQLEQQAGRVRPYPNAPRTLDLDVLHYGSAHISSPRLTLPHPRWAQRAFVLVPLAEVAPDRVSAAQLQAVQGQPIVRL
jgi:2-amino-4-hydroxy-6-hydroxymethyldihydropteridine diphosphokinase